MSRKTARATAAPRRKAGKSPPKQKARKLVGAPIGASPERKKRSAHQRKTSKRDAISGLLRRSEGANIDELIKATGWQAHSIRATLTGLRKAGHQIVRTKDGQGGSRYRIAASR
jgi:hypothetical protein